MEFVDTNVLIYANDRSAGTKRIIAKDLLQRLNLSDEGALSMQVLSEFYGAVTAKGILPDGEAAGIIWDYSHWTLHRPSFQNLLEAATIRTHYRISWWDALIVNSAIQLGCPVLWSEDLNNGQQYGSVTVRNPFRT